MIDFSIANACGDDVSQHWFSANIPPFDEHRGASGRSTIPGRIKPTEVS
jgi:hypothetical protein